MGKLQRAKRPLEDSPLLHFFRTLGGVSIYVIAFVFGGLLTYFWFSATFLSPAEEGSQQVVPFNVEKGWNIKTISKALEEKELINDWWSVYLLSRLQQDKIAKNGVINIFPGEYRITKGMTPNEVLQALVKGELIYYEILIPEGTRIKDMPDMMARSGLVTPEEALTALQDKTLIAEQNIPASSLEGYVFPDTYKFTRSEDATSMVRKMLEEGTKKRTKEMYEKAVSLGLTFHQILTLASIIEKETGDPAERPIISSVFHNRLRIGMPLQTDPTVIYGIENFDGNLTKQQLTEPGPYNTYLNTGLPPTPICSPGLDAINAALNPEETEYLYFVSRGDGTHQFSASYKEHREAVKRYQSKPAEKVEVKAEVKAVEANPQDSQAQTEAEQILERELQKQQQLQQLSPSPNEASPPS